MIIDTSEELLETIKSNLEKGENGYLQISQRKMYQWLKELSEARIKIKFLEEQNLNLEDSLDRARD